MRYRPIVWPPFGLFVVTALAAAQVLAQDHPGGFEVPFVPGAATTMILITGDETLPADPNVFAGVFAHAGDVSEPALAAGYNCRFEPVKSPSGNIAAAMRPRGSMIGYLILEPYRDKKTGDPKQITAAVVERIERFLAKLNQPRLNAMASQSQRTQLRLAECRDEIGRLLAEQEGNRHALVALGGSISAEGLDQQRRGLLGQSISIDVELAGLKARRQAVLKRLAEHEKRLAEQRDEPDYTVKGLEADAQVCRQDYLRCREANKKLPGSIPNSEVEQARLRWNAAELRVKAHSQTQKRRLSDDVLAGLNQQLADVDIETAAMEAKHAVVQATLERLKPDVLRRLAERMEVTGNRLRQLLDQQAAAERELAELSDRIGAFQMPKIMVLDDVRTGPAQPKKEPASGTPAKR